ncbi:hypothetical protein ACHAWO_002735 [Cyclotella atomus]|uniref:RING-type domain-containing protein n=1 Tax=Cyclotella atomus TaxID=382360 RepID=A0ABD3QMD8_9STRA
MTDEDTDCPICLNPMTAPDISHPIPCPCSFNFCVTCLSSLLASSKDDWQMASDGNRHVKVRLNCPNCRKDISSFVEPVIEERRVAKASLLQDIPDCELSSTELRQKYWTKADGLVLESDKEEKGKIEKKRVLEIDTTLFGGLEFAMTEQEQKYVTELMTSGYADKLAQAAQILEGTAELLRKGVAPSLASNNETKGPASSPINREAAATARTTAMLAGGYSNTAGIGHSRSRDGTEPPISNFQRQMEQKARDKIRRPLPSRMPLSVTLSTGEFEKLALATRQQAGLIPEEKKPWWKGVLGDAKDRLNGTISFIDDEWDGSIADAFARARIGPSKENKKEMEVQKRVTKANPAEKMSINRILKVGEEEHENKQDDNMPVIRTQRVLVANIRGQAGKSGIQRGDVVTHVNGEVFTGNAADLNAMLVNMYEEQGRDGVVMIVVNADECTAEALRLRSRIR